METHYFAASNDASTAVSSSGKNMSASKSRGQEWDPSALIDITNDSPIVGLANGVILDTPLTKQRGSRMKNTPGSGEDLLRGQVKTLLLKVEEEVEVSMFSLESSELLAPMPMNLSGLSSVTPSHVSQQPVVPQVVNQENFESEKSVISRALLLDFSDKSPDSNSPEERFSDLVSSSFTEDDDGSIWSMQANASIHDEEEEKIGEDKEDYIEDIEGLCEVLNKINMNERIPPKFEGKHTRFVYDSDDEIVKEEVEENCAQNASSQPNILCLKGLPTPKGKHLRFYDEEEEEEVKSSL
ncbi:hypothetical protein ACSQ67_003225 [Phaseolus vulgaris]